MSEPLAERMRPRSLADYVGKKHLVGEGAVLRKMIDAGRISSFILWGPPGVGKTTLAQIVAQTLKVPFYTLSAVTSGVKDVREVIERAKSGRFFNSASPILFIDEIHRLAKPVEEVLYSAMEDFYIDIVVGEGQTTHAVHVPLPPFTLIGATTRAGQLSAPLRDRFGIIEHMQYYSVDDLEKIIQRSSVVFNTKIDPEAAIELARRSRGTPRVANRLLKRVRDFAEVKGEEAISLATTKHSLHLLEVDDEGLDQTDRKLLRMMIENYGGGPVGIKTIAANVGEDTDTIEEVYEPYLLQKGFITRTPRGRSVTQKAYLQLGYPPKKAE